MVFASVCNLLGRLALLKENSFAPAGSAHREPSPTYQQTLGAERVSETSFHEDAAFMKTWRPQAGAALDQRLPCGLPGWLRSHRPELTLPPTSANVLGGDIFDIDI